MIGVALAYLAATAEWVAPLLLLCTPVVIGGEPGAMTVPVFLGLFIIVSMHVCTIHISSPFPRISAQAPCPMLLTVGRLGGAPGTSTSTCTCLRSTSGR